MTYLLKTWLREMMMEDTLALVVGWEAANEVWFTIKEQMLPVTTKKIKKETWLKDNLYWLKKESSGLEEFLRKLKRDLRQLSNYWKPFANEDKVLRLPHSLRPKYANFKTAMLTKPPYPRLKQFLLALNNHEQSWPKRKEYIRHKRSLFWAKGKRRNQHGGRFNGRGKRQNQGGRNISHLLMW